MNQQQGQNDRLDRLKKMGYKGPTGPGPLNEDVNSQVHSPAVRRKFSDVLNGQYKDKYRTMFSKKSKTGPQSFAPIPTSNNNVKVADDKKVEVADFSSQVDSKTNSELSMIDKMFDPDFGSSRATTSPSGNIVTSMDDYGPNWDAVNVTTQLKKRLNQRQQQAEYTENYPVEHQNQGGSSLSYKDFANDKQAFAPSVPQVAESTKESREDYKSYKNYMYSMNEDLIRKIAEEISVETVKSVLSEHIKAERDKYAFEKVRFKKKNGTHVELLKREGKYYELTNIDTPQGVFTVLKERKVKLKKS